MNSKENLYTPDCIRTFTGKYVNVFEPTPEMFCIEDIAHALSMQCRFGGHLPKFYSVAEHSIDVAAMVSDQYKLQALMHDASESYLLDLPRPIKNKMPDYKSIEHKLMICISSVFGFDWPMNEDVKRADEEQLKYEWHAIMLKGNENKICWNQQQAKQIFLNKFYEFAN